ncbi:MAG: hypothetical protein UIH27_12665 [Ruminococcus sp.]|nr:hypothetical protein [Ruminococcus sp.]
MSEVPFETEQAAGEVKLPDPEPVCLDAARIYDSCGTKDCLRDLTVFFTEENQTLIDTATSVRVNKISVITASVDVDSVAFHRGYYAVDIIYYFNVCCEVYSGAANTPAAVNGLATSSKRVVLYGSDACVKVFSSDTEPEIDVAELDCCNGYPVTMPRATVQVSSPMALASSVVPVTAPVIPPFVPEKVVEFFGAEIIAPVAQQVTVTVGVFTITQLSRNVQLMMPSYDFCVPRKECDARTDDPCEAFGKIDFPADSFFPPSSIDSDGEAPAFDCHCR